VIPRECKRLIEVDFPIAAVGKHALAEKARRFGTPHQIHLWWAWRPLAACRAVLLGLLLPDPCDGHCPDQFKAQARRLLLAMRGRPQGWTKKLATDLGLRAVLLQFIGDFANWDNAADASYLKVGRGLVKAAHPEETPLVVDPFAGGGSIPLEALRLGCEAFASDLNPVACLILKVKLEDIPRRGPALAEELRRVGKEIKEAVGKELAEVYPPDPDSAGPIAYLWARTVRCEAPNCGAEIPLVRSFWLCKKASRKRALRTRVERPRGRPPRVEFEVFEPTTERDVPPGTVSRAKARCLACNTVLAPERVRAQLAEQRGGADVILDRNGGRTGGARLLAVVTLKESEAGRQYRLGTDRDYEAVRKAQRRLARVLSEWERGGRKGLCPVPDEPLPPIGTLGFRVQRYGMLQWGDLFTARQKLGLVRFCDAVAALGGNPAQTGAALCAGKLAERNNADCDWMVDVECPGHLYTQQVIPPSWDFAEAVASSGSSGSWDLVVENTAANVESSAFPEASPASVLQGDAVQSPIPSAAAACLFTDPPYYDAVPYADLSDFFFVWLKRALPGHALLRDAEDLANRLTPKVREIVQDETKQFEGRPKDRAFFEGQMAKAFAEARRVLRDDGVGCVVFAHKTTEGWEALLSGMIQGGWVVVGSWPVLTERSARMRARESAALATSVHLVVRPRTEDSVGDWQSVARELPRRVRDWMDRLQKEYVRGADLVFACIGPALEIYSRYAKVVDAQDRPIPLGGDPEASEPHKRGYLAYVWETVARVALEQVLGGGEGRGAGALEEDARLTALFLWTLQDSNGIATRGGTADEEETEEGAEDDEERPSAAKKKGFSLIFDVARRFAQPLGIHLDDWEGRTIETEKGIVRLLPVTERARSLFGEEGAEAVADDLESRRAGPAQLKLFPDEEAAPRVRGRHGGRPLSDEQLQAQREATTLDRVHAAMLLQRAGRTQALRALLAAEQDRGPDFLRLANSLSALYPRESEEKRLLDAMLLVVPR
jgi:adenine-specific DNA methylase